MSSVVRNRREANLFFACGSDGCTTKPCTQLLTQPLLGGGYCYCDDGCGMDFTDNNSYGSCCADQWWKCRGREKDVECLDARSQTAALSLFVAQAEVERLAAEDPGHSAARDGGAQHG